MQLYLFPLGRLVVCCIFTFVARPDAIAQTTFSNSVSDGEPSGDNVCGPRCVKFLLQWYHKQDVPLIDLVREMQWPNIERGSSLEDIAHAINSRGISTLGCKVQDLEALNWEFPVVLYLDSATGAPLGHFVVMLPKDDSQPQQVFCALGSWAPKKIDISWLTNHYSGNLLLTANNSIDDSVLDTFHSKRDANFAIFAVCFACVAIFVGTIEWLRRRS
jgi:ABC-type bacteriocin/lantibiotic exporter with double-glycine peptidase domain